MSKAEIEKVIKDHLYEDFIGEGNQEELTESLHLYDAGILDSIGTLQLADFIEKKWPITIEAHEMMKANFSTIEAICNFIERKMA